MQVIKDWLQVGAYAAATFAALLSWWQYRKNSARERARWLIDLFHRFYEEPIFKEMRIAVDWGETAFVRAENDKSLLGKLDDYLNFFELVAHLQDRKGLKPEEVKAMFDYPLRAIAQDKDVLPYLRKYGYEQLDALLKKLGYAK